MTTSTPAETPEPSACRHCGVRQYDHLQRWTKGVGWHGWTEPTV